MNARLTTLTELTRKFGGAEYVKGGGGNSSAKTADTLWVKPSGSTMIAMTPERFVALNRAGIGRMDEVPVTGDVQRREAAAKEILAAAARPESRGRPSVETPLHNLFDAIYVIHTHPALVNGLTCAKNGKTICARLFPEALWIDYIDPGITLYQHVRDKVAVYQRRSGRQPEVLFLKNHGVFVAADTPERITAVYADILTRLKTEYAAAGISLALTEQPLELNTADIETIKKAFPAAERQALISIKSFATADGPISPDHIVYMKSFVHKGTLSETSVADFRRIHGYYPKLLETPAAVYAVGTDLPEACLALELARDGALIKQLAAAFGGITYLDDAARGFIENWEVESYRRKQLILMSDQS
ncbi:MAG: class II aldolase/adducin family protein [Victivallaceae bacterium]|nr:class II aldolase/adducin family protein [Victivallaceae bacterium]